MAEPHDWPFEQPARGTLRPWYLTAAGYLAVLFPDGQEAQRAKQGLLQRGLLANDVRLYDAEEVLSIASRLQQERSILAKAIAAVVSDREARQRYLGNARRV
jgi:histidinol-phosphate/aromatic aminotransferase/cobyric acid decarboxylase-like protein